MLAILCADRIWYNVYAGLDIVCEIFRQAPANTLPEFNAQKMMIETYSALGSTDVLYGWGVNKLTDDQSR